MGIGISGWPLARAVSLREQLGVVSGTALDLTFMRRLQLGDPGGHTRRGLDAFPDQEMARRIRDKYFIAGGKAEGKPFKNKSMIGQKPNRRALELMVLANFVEVYLAKEGHDGVVEEVRGVGAMFGLKIAGERTPAEVRDRLHERGVIARPIGADTLTFSPPLVITDEEIGRVVDAVAQSLAD